MSVIQEVLDDLSVRKNKKSDSCVRFLFLVLFLVNGFFNPADFLYIVFLGIFFCAKAAE